jgi:FKBP-type peptidyl-prolyl cis-trans isomerase FklB
MADPNGKEAGAKFLEENKTKDRVVTLPSGLQYKVLKEGRGTDHPTVSTPCECHYAGKLLDGSQFDSSYSRGQPTTFAPNQVIKGWTEAMQLMVQGDKWEMYIPYNLAYGENGKPPKIPPAACLIFTMEIMKIKGATVPAKIDFPEWTEEQLKLWEEKDEAQITGWVEAKEKEWEEGKLKEKYPTRDEFDEWLKVQSKKAKDKSLWKRTRQTYEEPQEAPAADACCNSGG